MPTSFAPIIKPLLPSIRTPLLEIAPPNPDITPINRERGIRSVYKRRTFLINSLVIISKFIQKFIKNRRSKGNNNLKLVDNSNKIESFVK